MYGMSEEIEGKDDEIKRLKSAIKSVLEKKDEYDETMVEYLTDLDGGKQIEKTDARKMLLCAIEDLRTAYENNPA